MQTINVLFNHYGYIVLFISLMLELIAFPLPGEVLMSYCGFLIFQGKLNWIVSIIIAASGTILGITISYWIGITLGVSFFKRYGAYVHMGPEKLERTSKWFDRYGNKLLTVAFFIPGVRHITGYFSGITKVSYGRFAVNAYIGALIWTSTFISLGKVLGADWDKFHAIAKKYLVIGSLILAVIMIIIYIFRNYREEIVEYFSKLLRNTMRIFNSLGKIKIAVAGVAFSSLGLLIIVVGLIQDYLANEFKDFDTIATVLIKLIFGKQWLGLMIIFSEMTSFWVVIPLGTVIIMWILLKGKDKFLETRFVIIVILGGEVLEWLLTRVFHRVGPSGNIIIDKVKYTFPSNQAFMVLVIYGLILFFIIRYYKNSLFKQIVMVVTIAICIFVGLSTVYLGLQFPSDVTAGYVFGGIWLGVNIVWLEVLRILPKI